MASFFRGTVQSTPFQQAIEKVTDGNQPTEDWGTIMKICDHVALHEDNAKEAMKAIRKRLQINPVANGWRSIGYTLTLLEALTKNCGKTFHVQLVQKDFLKELQAIIAPKNNPPPDIQDKILHLIQTWALAFRGDPDLKYIEQFYLECQQQGFEFPPAESESIIKAAVPAKGTIERPTRSMSQPTPGTVLRQNRSASDGSPQQQVVLRQMTAEQLAKLRSELDVVQTNAQVFGEMLIILQPGDEHPQDLDLLIELHKTCKQMQLRIIDLLSQISIDDVTVDLLRYNDEFNNSFKTFESYMQERERRVGPTQMPILNRTASPPPPQTNFSTSQSPTKTLSLPRNQDNEPALIKFDEDPTILSSNLRNTHINSPSTDAAPKNLQQQSTASVTTRSVSNNQDVDRDAKEVEQWLNGQSNNNNNNNSHQERDTTNAFNEFIQKRASTIPDETPVSEQDIYINLQPQQPSTQNQSNASNV